MTTVQDIEKHMHNFWKDNNIPEKVRGRNKGKKKFYFLDGPPYATGYIHIGTAWNKILKDVYIRYWRMKGFDVWDQPGYDTHGLPIENKVEQKLGFKSKTDIENLGIKKFNQECRSYATQFIGIMNSQFEDLGVWMNWDKPYLTLNNDYIEGAWHTFKMGFEKGLLYKDFYPVHVCPRCVDKDSVVLLNNYDTKTIGDLEDSWHDRKIITTDIKNNTLISKKITSYYNLGKEPCFEIKTRESSKTLIATNDHPFWVKNKGWVPLGQICVGDKVAVYNHPDYSYNTSIRDDIILDENLIIKNVSGLRKKISNKCITKRFYALDDYKREKIIELVQKLRESGNSLRKIQSMVLSSYKVKISFGSILNIASERKKKNISKNSIEVLDKLGLLPLSLDNPKLPIIARILGHIFGDGSISVRKRGQSSLGFYINFSGEERDLLRIKKDLKSLGFKSYKITKKITNSVINSRKVVGYSRSFRCESTPLAVLLISLGAPLGKKSLNAFAVPKWILKAPDFIVREFLGAYFGSELNIIKPRDYGKGFETLRFHLHKTHKLKDNGLLFAKQITKLLKKFNVETGKILVRDIIINNKKKVKITVPIRCCDENIKNFVDRIGYRYCNARENMASYASAYLNFKKSAQVLLEKKHKEIKKLKNNGMSLKEIQNIIKEDFSFLGYSFSQKKPTARVAKYIPSFYQWLKDNTENLPEGMIWETVESIRDVGIREVRDIRVDQLHNFIVNGFLTHNCETAVAYNEIEYTQITDPSVFIKFPVLGKENEFLLIWTTTPWTLPSNTGIMAKPDADYVHVKLGSEILILAETRLQDVMERAGMSGYRIIKKMKGKELEGLRYEHPLRDVFPFIRKLNNAHRVVLSDQFVSMEEGTGLVHTAPGHGQEDYKVGKENGLPVVSPLKMNGTFNDNCGRFVGIFAKSADDEILEEFKVRGLLFHQEKITHEYPQCWRCSSPLLFMSVPQWFFKVTSIRNKLIEENKKVKWYPEWAGKRFENWLESLGDWPISRQRYWGIPLPIWECERCEKIKVIGSRKELPKVPEDFHRPFIDEIEIECECKGKMKRVPDVLDVWFDAGLAGWASLNYSQDKKQWERLWPSDLQIEGPDQIRGWWNAQLITSIITFNEKPFQNILFHGFVLDAHGNKMSKSVGNIVQPEDVVAKYGRDVLRFYLLSSPAWDDFYFNWTDTENTSKILNILRNTFNFIKTYVTKKPSEKPKLKVEDEWIISRLNSIIQEYDKNMSSYNHHKSVDLLQNFILNDLSRWYIKLVRDRVWPSYEGKDKEAAFYTLNKVSEVLLKLLAPLTPHLAEQFYQDLVRKSGMPESIHMFDLPKADKKAINLELEEQMKVAKMIFETSSAVRQKEKIKLKWPVKKILIISNDKIVKTSVNKLKDLLENICNAKSVSLTTKTPKGKLSEGVFELGKLYLDIEVDEELYEEMLYREVTRTIQELRKKNKFVIKDEIILTLKSDLNTEKILKKFTERLKHDVGAISFNVGELKGKIKDTLEFDDVKIEIAFDKK